MMCGFITIMWIIFRSVIAVKNKRISIKNELKLLLVYICIIVIARFVYFPMHMENGRVVPLNFDSSKIYPFRINIIPLVHLSDIYDGWQLYIIGNIVMFIPVGIILPFCFKQLNNIGKTILTGIASIIFIELSQLFFYERCTDIDDFILNTTGVILGAAIYFGIKRIKSQKKDV